LKSITLNENSTKNSDQEIFTPKRGFIIENEIKGITTDGSMGITETVNQIMLREKNTVYKKKDKDDEEIEPINPDRTHLLQNPDSRNLSLPALNAPASNTPQTLGISFHATELDPVNWMFPADNMGAVGPSQVIVAVNNRFKTFNKNTGVADGALDVSPDNFFATVRSTSSTCDFRIRYDRATSKWFIIGINVANTNNRLMFAVSSGPTITSASNFTFFYIAVTGSVFFDYPTIGIDENALYIGGNVFDSFGSFVRTDGYVIKKISITGVGPIQSTLFTSLATGSTQGPYTPQGVDNFDPSPTYGYFIGVDALFYGTLSIRRVSNPGGTPTISVNIPLTVSTTTAPFNVPHLGNTNGTTGYLSAIDERLYAAVIRNGFLWTAHSFNVDLTGTPVSSALDRQAVRWYQIQNLSSSPTIAQSGTIFDNAASNPKNYWIPTFMVSGQGHVASVFSVAGANNYIDIAISGRLASDAAGTMGTPVLITNNTSFAYNPVSDPGSSRGRRWGDYSFVSLDPDDDMTMWAFHGYCSATNIWGVRAAQLKAPPPATPASSNPVTVNSGLSSVNVVINGTSVSGSGWYDPGAGFAKRINATLSNGATLNSITYTDPTHVTLDINTSNVAGPVNSPNANVPIYVTIINPDGQSTTSATGIITVQGVLPVELSTFTSNVSGRDVKLNWTTASEQNNAGFDIQRTTQNGNENWTKIGYVTGNGTKTTPTNYSFDDKKLNTGEYLYRLKQTDYNGNFEYFSLAGSVDISVPRKFDVSQNYPNPFNPVTKIDYSIPQSGLVTLKVYDILGKEVKTLINKNQETGYYTVGLDASSLASGIYFYTLQSGNAIITKKLMVIK
jgi:hypothetical protein